MPRRYIKEEPTHNTKHTNHHHYAALLTGIALIAISLYHLHRKLGSRSAHE